MWAFNGAQNKDTNVVSKDELLFLMRERERETETETDRQTDRDREKCHANR